MSDLNYNYRQYIMHNTLKLQKNKTKNVVKACCYCNNCADKTFNYLNYHTNNNIYTTEPSDLQQNYNSQFRASTLRAQLNTHKV